MAIDRGAADVGSGVIELQIFFLRNDVEDAERLRHDFRSDVISREDGEHLAAVASGFHSLAKGAGRHFKAGSVRQTRVELDGGYLFVVAAGGGTCLAVFSGPECDIGLVAYEMARLVRRVGEHLFAAPRAGSGAGAAAS